jgi:cobalamin biosynthesis protein CobD/CbiB
VKETSDRRLAKKPQRAVGVALLVVTILIAALLVTFLTLPLLSRSLVVFAVVAGSCWAAVFAAAVLVTRSLGRPSAAAGGSAGAEPLAESPEGILDHAVANDVGLEEVAAGAAHAEKRVD